MPVVDPPHDSNQYALAELALLDGALGEARSRQLLAIYGSPDDLTAFMASNDLEKRWGDAPEGQRPGLEFYMLLPGETAGSKDRNFYANSPKANAFGVLEIRVWGRASGSTAAEMEILRGLCEKRGLRVFAKATGAAGMPKADHSELVAALRDAGEWAVSEMDRMDLDRSVGLAASGKPRAL